MTKYVLPDKRMHLVTRLSVLFIIAPYMAYVALKHSDYILLAIAIALILFDSWSLLGKKSDDDQIHQLARLTALLVQVPYMLYAGVRYNDKILILLAIITAIADAYTFYLGTQKF